MPVWDVARTCGLVSNPSWAARDGMNWEAGQMNLKDAVAENV